MTKIDPAKLKKEIEAQDLRDSRKKGHNVNALRLMLDAAKGVKDEKSFKDAFTPTRGNHRIARNLGLNLDVQRGRWVEKEVSEQMMVEGKELVTLLLQALEDGDTVRFTEQVNKLLSYKVAESLADQRKLIAEQMVGEGIPELVKASNLDVDADPAAGEEDLLSNADLATSPSDDDEAQVTEQRPAMPRFEVGEPVEVEVANGKYKKGKIAKVGRTQREGLGVKIGGKTENWPIGLVRKLKEGSESERLGSFQ